MRESREGDTKQARALAALEQRLEEQKQGLTALRILIARREHRLNTQ